MMIASSTLQKGIGRSVLVSRNGGWKTCSNASTSQVAWKSSKASPDRNSSEKKSSSLLASMAEHYTNLRWKFATSLTESLPKDKQAELLERLNFKPQQMQQDDKQQAQVKAPEEQTSQPSIQEAIAAAKAEEAQRQTAKWEKEKEKLMAEAEAAAKARVENELLIQHRRLAFERWQEELNQSDEAKSEPAGENGQTSVAAAIDAAIEEPPIEEPISVQDHPVLGSSIADLGYKRVHIASVQALKSLPVWKKQRTYRHSRAKSMAQDKMKTLHLGMPGIIALHEDFNGNLSIIDGQHRVGMMAILEEQKEKVDGDIFDLDRVLVEVYPEEKQSEQGEAGSSDSTHAQDIFLEINKAEPVKLVDLPGVGLTKTDRKTINEGAARLSEAFPEMFSPSQRCRAPHLNVDNLRDALFASEVISRNNLKSPKALEAWMMEQNEILKAEYADGSKKASSVSKKALEKAVKNNFFLGLDSSWLYH